MSDLSFLDPPIEIAAGSPRLEMIVSRLKSCGMRPYVAADVIDFSAPDPLLIDVATVPRDVLYALSRAAMVESHRRIVLVDLSSTLPASGGETVTLRRDRDLAALRSRLTALTRRSSRQREAEIRRETASALGVRIPPADHSAIPSLLYIGEGSPLFLSLQGPLQRRGIEVTAAISRDTARRYMSERRFAAALVDLDSFKGDVSATSRWIAEDNGLGALPIIALSHPDLHLNDRQNTVIALATEIVDAKGRMAQIVSMIETACRRLAAFAPFAPPLELASGVSDAATGLFSARFLESHTARQMSVATQRAEPLCVVTFRLDPALATCRASQKQFAALIRAQIRDYDCPALLQPGMFAVSLPATPYRGGALFAERLAEVAAQYAPLVENRFGWRVIEKRAYHTPQTLLGAGITGPMLRPRLAA